MDLKKTSVTDNIRVASHWVALAILIYIFGYAGLYKIFEVPGMIKGMAEIGFGKTATLLIGLAEVAGVIGVMAGLFYRPFKIIAVLCLMPFAFGAFTVHLSYHHPFEVYLNSLLVCIMPLLILLTDKKFRVIIK